MENIIPRPQYLEKLISRRENGDIKIITGIRRCGKSWLLSKIYRQYLIGDGVNERNIIMASLETNPLEGPDLTTEEALKEYLLSRITNENEQYYVFLDEIQLIPNFERLVMGLNKLENVDLYITGSNSRFLSSDLNTIFRGRGDEIRVYPLSFKEFAYGKSSPVSEIWKEYYTFGGMPGLIKRHTEEQKTTYLKRLWSKTYIDDIIERNQVRNVKALEMIIDSLCSSIGSLTNYDKIRKTLNSVSGIKTDTDTITRYIGFVENAFLLAAAQRYNIKGKRYYETLRKYYATDIGLRNARLNFRQQEISHIMENIIYNELTTRGYMVDVGIVEKREKQDDKYIYKQLEVDFIATNGMKKYYIQSAFAIPDEEKREQELKSLLNIDDSFTKIVIVGDDIATYINEEGIIFMGLFRFLLNTDILE